MEKEFIERESLRKAMQFATDDPTCPLHIKATVDQYICEHPAADVVERKRGEWVAVECGTICTNCNRVFDHNFEIPHHVCRELTYCPNCGAKMKE